MTAIDDVGADSWRDQDITYYFNENCSDEPEDWLSRPLGGLTEKFVAGLERGPQRWPVRNREPRVPVGPIVRGLISGRDGEFCRRCGDAGVMEIDHIIPRCAFRPDQLHIADRSDNLRNVCVDCNESKSNFHTVESKRLGVTRRCGWCVAGHSYMDHEECDESCPTWGDLYGFGKTYQVYCGRCGVGAVVPSLEWVL